MMREVADRLKEHAEANDDAEQSQPQGQNQPAQPPEPTAHNSPM